MLKCWPVIERELRIMSRARSTYFSRIGIGVLGIIGTMMMAFFDARSPNLGNNNIGLQMFSFLSMVILTFSIFSGIRYTSDCIAAEKRNGTLGLLFLTDLSTMDILLGKLSANSFRALLNLLATVPVLSFTILYGGVTIEMVLKLSLISVNQLILSLVIGLTASVFQTQSKAAFSTASSIVVGIHFILPFIATLLQKHFSQFVWFINGYIQAFQIAGMGGPGGNALGAGSWLAFAVTQGFVLGLSLILFRVCIVKLSHSWRNFTNPVESQPARKFRLWPSRSTPKPKPASKSESHQSEASTTQPASGNRFAGNRGGLRLTSSFPLDYLFSHRKPEITSACAMGFLAALYLIILKVTNGFDEPIAGLVGIMLSNLIFKWQWASVVIGAAHRERRDGTLEFLISTPLKLSTIFTSLRRAAAYDLRYSIIVQALFQVIMHLIIFVGDSSSKEDHFWTFYCTSYVFLILDIAALIYGGAWLGLTCVNYSNAFTQSIVWIIGMPTFLLYLLIILFSSIQAMPNEIDFQMMWLVMGIGWAVLVILFCKAWVTRYIRIIGSIPFGKKLTFKYLEVSRNSIHSPSALVPSSNPASLSSQPD